MLERQTFQNKDLVLKVSPSYDPKRFDPNKYEAFLDALCGDREYQKEAIGETVRYFLGGEYKSLKELAEENYHSHDSLQTLYGTFDQFKNHLQIHNKLSCSLDLATGTGKSYVIYGIARIMLAETESWKNLNCFRATMHSEIFYPTMPSLKIPTLSTPPKALPQERSAWKTAMHFTNMSNLRFVKVLPEKAKERWLSMMKLIMSITRQGKHLKSGKKLILKEIRRVLEQYLAEILDFICFSEVKAPEGGMGTTIAGGTGLLRKIG